MTAPKYDIRMIVTDLDGTILDSKKRLPEENREALIKANERGIVIVPATGRFYKAVTEEIRSLPFIRYYMTENGAGIYDAQEGIYLHSIGIPWDKALKIREFLTSYGMLHDYFQDGTVYIKQEDLDRFPEYIENESMLKLFTSMRTPVPDPDGLLRENKRDVQKIQMLFKDPTLRQEMFKRIREAFPDISVTAAYDINIELNAGDANKGNAIQLLCGSLGLDLSQVLAIGDGLNDIPMLKTAGIGVCMSNGVPEAIVAADYITDSNDNAGFARALERFCFRDNETAGS